MRGEEKFYDGRWLDFGQILIGEARHRTFKCFYFICCLQCVFVGLVLNESAVGIANGHHDQAENTREQEEEGQCCRISKRVIKASVNYRMQNQVSDVESTQHEK